MRFALFFFKNFVKITKTKCSEEIDIPGLGTEDRIINQNPTWNNEQVRDPFNRPAARTGNFQLTTLFYSHSLVILRFKIAKKWHSFPAFSRFCPILCPPWCILPIKRFYISL